jgi:glycyl-tRNA synthetase
VDHQTLEDDTVTLRDRDSTKQVRIAIKDLCSVLWQLMDGKIKFEKAGKPIK